MVPRVRQTRNYERFEWETCVPWPLQAGPLTWLPPVLLSLSFIPISLVFVTHLPMVTHMNVPTCCTYCIWCIITATIEKKKHASTHKHRHPRDFEGLEIWLRTTPWENPSVQVIPSSVDTFSKWEAPVKLQKHWIRSAETWSSCAWLTPFAPSQFTRNVQLLQWFGLSGSVIIKCCYSKMKNTEAYSRKSQPASVLPILLLK